MNRRGLAYSQSDMAFRLRILDLNSGHNLELRDKLQGFYSARHRDLHRTFIAFPSALAGTNFTTKTVNFMYANSMMFIISSFILLGIITALFWYFDRRRDSDHSQNTDADIRTYMDQLSSVDRDLARGVIDPADVATLRVEIERRISDAKRVQSSDASISNQSPWIVIAPLGSAIALSVALYVVFGAPFTADAPIHNRIANLEAAKAQRPSQAEAEAIYVPILPRPATPDEARLALVEQLRGVLKTRPNDVQGLRLLVQQEIRLGNYVAARETQQALVDALGTSVSVEDLANLFDIMLYNADDYISPEAEEVLLRLRQNAPDLLLGKFYQGMLEIQAGRLDKAFLTWKAVAENSPPNAPWFDFVRGEMPALAAAAGVRYNLPPVPAPTRGPSAIDIDAADAMSGEDRQAMIEGMVAGLSERLANEGGTAAEWQQLIRALTVLGQMDRARVIAQEARVAFASNPELLSQINALIIEIGLE